MLWVVSFLENDAFLPIWISFAIDFYSYIFSSGYRNKKFKMKISESLFNQTEQTYIKQTWYVSSFEVV